MSQITFVRHGQAQTNARDEASYDQLSPLGHQQAKWLGEHMTIAGTRFERVYCGTLIRQNETAISMGANLQAEIIQDSRLNEIEYFTLAELIETQHGLPIPDSREGFVAHLPALFALWQAGDIDNPPESFQAFEERVSGVIDEIANGKGAALAVTSAGLISMVLRLTMGLDTPAMSRACLAIMNTSVHHLHRLGDSLALTHFNGVPHLENTERRYAQTHL